MQTKATYTVGDSIEFAGQKWEVAAPPRKFDPTDVEDHHEEIVLWCAGRGYIVTFVASLARTPE